MKNLEKGGERMPTLKNRLLKMTQNLPDTEKEEFLREWKLFEYYLSQDVGDAFGCLDRMIEIFKRNKLETWILIRVGAIMLTT